MKGLVAPVTHSAQAVRPQVPDKSSDSLPKCFPRQPKDKVGSLLKTQWGQVLMTWEEAGTRKSVPLSWISLCSLLKFILFYQIIRPQGEAGVGDRGHTGVTGTFKHCIYQCFAYFHMHINALFCFCFQFPGLGKETKSKNQSEDLNNNINYFDLLDL